MKFVAKSIGMFLRTCKKLQALCFCFPNWIHCTVWSCFSWSGYDQLISVHWASARSVVSSCLQHQSHRAETWECLAYRTVERRCYLWISWQASQAIPGEPNACRCVSWWLMRCLHSASWDRPFLPTCYITIPPEVKFMFIYAPQTWIKSEASLAWWCVIALWVFLEWMT